MIEGFRWRPEIVGINTYKWKIRVIHQNWNKVLVYDSGQEAPLELNQVEKVHLGSDNLIFEYHNQYRWFAKLGFMWLQLRRELKFMKKYTQIFWNLVSF